MAKEISKLTLNSASVFSLLNTRLADISRRIDASVDANRDWNDQLEDDEMKFVHRLADILSWRLQDGDEDAFITEAMLNENDAIRRLRSHKHECGQRMTGGAVVVEVS